MFDVSPAEIAQFDQQVAALRQALQAVVDAHRWDCEQVGDLQAMLGIAQACMTRSDDMLVVNLLTVAINRLAKVEDDFA